MLSIKPSLNCIWKTVFLGPKLSSISENDGGQFEKLSSYQVISLLQFFPQRASKGHHYFLQFNSCDLKGNKRKRRKKERKRHSQKDREDEKTEGYVPHEGTR